MVNKKVVIISTIIFVLIIGAIIGIKIKKLDNNENIISKEKPKVSEVQNNTIENNIVNNTVNNEIKNEIVNEVENTTKNNNTTISENTVKNTSTSETKTNNNLTGEEKAKKLAKDKWGKSDDNVYYYVEEKLSENEYIVSVRDSDTTVSLMDYKLNIKTEEISEY